MKKTLIGIENKCERFREIIRDAIYNYPNLILLASLLILSILGISLFISL